MIDRNRKKKSCNSHFPEQESRQVVAGALVSLVSFVLALDAELSLNMRDALLSLFFFFPFLLFSSVRLSFSLAFYLIRRQLMMFFQLNADTRRQDLLFALLLVTLETGNYLFCSSVVIK